MQYKIPRVELCKDPSADRRFRISYCNTCMTFFGTDCGYTDGQFTVEQMFYSEDSRYFCPSCGKNNTKSTSTSFSVKFPVNSHEPTFNNLMQGINPTKE